LNKVASSIARTMTMTTVFAVLAVGGLFVWQSRQEIILRERIASLEAEMQKEIAARDAMISRLSRSHRKGRLEVLAQKTGETGFPSERDGTKVIDTTVKFIELDDDGREIGQVTTTVPGDTVFLDAWTARFPKSAVAEGNPLRERTLLLFRRIYSDRMHPSQGTAIDTPGAAPKGYAGSDLAKLEQAVWAGFWKIASDPETARRHGIAVAQGEAVYKPVRAGEAYDIMLDAAAGLTLVPTPRSAKAE
jgi:hypothetical protein